MVTVFLFTLCHPCEYFARRNTRELNQQTLQHLNASECYYLYLLMPVSG